MVAHFTSAAAQPVAAARFIIFSSDDVETEETIIPVGAGRSAVVRTLRPRGAPFPHPTVFYFPDAAWREGDGGVAGDIVKATGSAVWILEGLADTPAGRLELAQAIVDYALKNAVDHGIDLDRLAVAGEGAGGVVAAPIAIGLAQRRDLRMTLQVLIYPQLGAGPMNGHTRDHPAPPETLSRSPRTLLIVADHDVLRDPAEAYGARLEAAGVDVTSVRFNGTAHGFLDRDEPAARTASALIISALRAALLPGR